MLDLSKILLTKDTVEIAREALANAEKKEKIDLLAIFEAWMLQFQLEKQSGPEIERETQQLADAALKELKSNAGDEEVHTAALDVLGALPARTAAEIILLRQLVEQRQDQQIQNVCSNVLKFARPLNDEGWQEIEKAQTSPVRELAEIAGQVMKRKPA